MSPQRLHPKGRGSLSILPNADIPHKGLLFLVFISLNHIYWYSGFTLGSALRDYYWQCSKNYMGVSGIEPHTTLCTRPEPYLLGYFSGPRAGASWTE